MTYNEPQHDNDKQCKWRFWVNDTYASFRVNSIRNARNSNTDLKRILLGSSGFTTNNFLLGFLDPKGNANLDDKLKGIVRNIPLDRTLSQAISILENK